MVPEAEGNESRQRVEVAIQKRARALGITEAQVMKKYTVIDFYPLGVMFYPKGNSMGISEKDRKGE